MNFVLIDLDYWGEVLFCTLGIADMHFGKCLIAFRGVLIFTSQSADLLLSLENVDFFCRLVSAFALQGICTFGSAYLHFFCILGSAFWHFKKPLCKFGNLCLFELWQASAYLQ